MKYVWIPLVVSASVLAGCARSPENISPAYVSPVTYEGLDCDQISLEIQSVSTRLGAASNAQSDAAGRDAVATGVGLVLFWPALFFLAAGDNDHEVARLKGEYQALESAAVRSDCDYAPGLVEERKRQEEEAKKRQEEREARQNSRTE